MGIRTLVGTGLALLVVGVAVLGAMVLTRHRDAARVASADHALQRFRDSAATSACPIPSGLHSYTTAGSESVSARGGTTHRYPTTSTITAATCSGAGSASSPGASLRWDVLEQRWTRRSVCPTVRWSASGAGTSGPLTRRSSDTTATNTGGARQIEVEDRGLESKTGLPIRLTSMVRTANSPSVGDVTYSESHDLQLTSLEPRR